MAHSKLTILAVLAVLALGMSACESGTTQGTVFTGGTNALLLDFEQNSPPNTIFDNSQTPFNILLKVKNDGEFDTKDIRWRITGINRNDFPRMQTDGLYDDTIMGRTKLQDQVIEGEEAYLELGGEMCYERSLAGGGELRDFSINAHVCYAYATLATSTVCIRENYLDGGDGCDPSQSSQISVSGAPVTISSFSQQHVGRDRLRLQYDVELKNNVRIWAPYEGQTCQGSQTDRIAERNQVFVRVDSNNLGDVSCVGLRTPRSYFDGGYVLSDAFPQDLLTGQSIRVIGIDASDEGYLRLGPDNRASLICTLTLAGGLTDSLGTMDIALSYYVEDSVTHPLTITHSGTTGGAVCGDHDERPQVGGGSGSNDPQLTS